MEVGRIVAELLKGRASGELDGFVPVEVGRIVEKLLKAQARGLSAMFTSGGSRKDCREIAESTRTRSLKVDSDVEVGRLSRGKPYHFLT